MPAERLADAHLRIERAREHLEQLEKLSVQTCRLESVAKRLDYQRRIAKIPANPFDLFTITPGNTPIPPLCRILAGEAAYNLRAALDYLVGELARLDSGPGRRRTQFPIERSKERFDINRFRSLDGLHGAHVASIERLQPYHGNAWTQQLQAITNLDKHNALIPAKFDFRYSGMAVPVKRTKLHATPYKVTVHVEPVIVVALGDGFELVHALREIVVKTVDALVLFDQDFR